MYKIFFDSYTQAMGEAYDSCLKSSGRDMSRGFDVGDEALEACLSNEYRKWSETPLEKLDGKTPAEFVNTVGSLEDLRQMFIYGSVVCDDELPEVFLDRLKSFGDDAGKLLVEIARGYASDNNGESLLASVMAVRVLGQWKVKDSAGPLTDILYSRGEPDELMLETVRDTLINIGAPALDKIIDTLEREHIFSAPDEYLLMALSETGRSNKSEKVYNCLKNSFLNMPKKTVAADSLAKYGDGRAVPAIRGFIKKNSGKLDKDTFYDLVSAVRHLGGNTDDLKFGI
ncbi:MAG TPA: hypothetical protein VHT96_09920 [Clostridia bacterium]|nr:hypothetical protein [Clostridia bacterium]